MESSSIPPLLVCMLSLAVLSVVPVVLSRKAVPRPKPPLNRLSELTAGQSGDFFVLLAERTAGKTRDGKRYYLCRFRDAQRTATAMIWADSPKFEPCDKEWREGH